MDAKAELQSRKRKVDINALSTEEADNLSEQIGQKIGQEVNEMCERVKKMLSVYGLDIKLTYIVHPVGEHPLDAFPDLQATLEPKKRGRKKVKV